jgi:hypothetical protein
VIGKRGLAKLLCPILIVGVIVLSEPRSRLVAGLPELLWQGPEKPNKLVVALLPDMTGGDKPRSDG